MSEGGIERQAEKKRQDAVLYSRHSSAAYGEEAKILASDNPQSAVNPEDQIHPDLTEAGIEFARTEAEKFFGNLDRQHDELFFVSSNQARALETAAIYRDVAKQKGFDVIAPDHVRGGFAQEIGGGDVRVVRNLSLKSENTLVYSVFYPDKNMAPINWEAASQQDPQIRDKWERAHKIIQEHDFGSWGANMFHHAPAVKQIFPEVNTAEDLYEGQFKNLLRLAEFGLNKAQKSDRPKNLKIIAFGHENYVGYALDKYFQEHDIKNCETISFQQDETGAMTLERRGQRAVL